MHKVKKVLRGFKPLCYTSDGLLISKGYKVYKSDFDLKNISYKGEIPVDFKKRCFTKSRVLSRILRLGISYAINVDDDFILMVCRSEIWRLCLKTNELFLEFTVPEFRTALYISIVENKIDLSKKIIFGEYFNNPNKVEVNIWCRDKNDNSGWHKIHTFMNGEINHVHNIVASKDNVYILTGDFESSAAIYQTDVSFSEVVPIMSGSQEYRACWGFFHSDKFLYAMDTQLDVNYFCCLENKKLTKLTSIEGSSIYYAENKSGCFFSTTVEPGEPTGNIVKDIFCMKPGPGILSSSSKIYYITDALEATMIFEGVKDYVPLRLGQFGSFSFPSGTRPDDQLIVYATALKKYDNCCLLLSK